jgi:hypothetical protein
MKKLLLIPAFILLMFPLMAEAQQNQLSQDARIDLLEVRALNALNNEDWPLFLENIDELDELGADLGIEVVLFVGRAHFELQQYERSYENVSDFLEAAGREHPNYVEALSLYDDVSERLEVQRQQHAEEYRLYTMVVNVKSLSSAQEYLRRFPQGRYRAEVSRAVDELTYRDAVTVSDLDNYLSSYPNGRFVSEARSRKRDLERENLRSSLEAEKRSSLFRLNRAKDQRKKDLTVLLAGVGGLAISAALLKSMTDNDCFNYENEDTSCYVKLGFALPSFAIGLGFTIGGGMRFNNSNNTVKREQNTYNSANRRLNQISLIPYVDPYENSYALGVRINF